MSTNYHAPMHNTVELDVIDNHARPLNAGELASLLSEVHASVLAHDELCHLADALEDVLFDVMRHARQRQKSLLAGKPGLVIAK
jgi:hypothetical protein